MQIVSQKGKLQKVNVMVCTYNEPMETVRECVQYLLDSPAPVYADKHIYIGDDGAKKKFECSDQKRQMVDEFRRRALPHPRVSSERHVLFEGAAGAGASSAARVQRATAT